jgi:aryl-alcohol dehydrogenase-like predicted oxidoreductase
MFESVERSLKRLQTTYIDILYVHLYDGTVDALELMISLDIMVRSNKVMP